MLSKKEFEELGAKLRYGLDLSYRRLLEETARRNETLSFGTPDGKVISLRAADLLKEQQQADAERQSKQEIPI